MSLTPKNLPAARTYEEAGAPTMKLKTTAILAACGVFASAAAAFAIPVTPGVTAEPGAVVGSLRSSTDTSKGSRMTAGDTLLVDARLGHSSLSKDSRGETYLFAQVAAGS